MGKSLLSGLVAGAAVIGVVGGAAVAFAGNGTDDGAADARRTVRQSATSSPARSPAGTPTGPTAPRPGVTAERGGQIALDATRGGQIIDIELEGEHGRLVWDVEIVKASREYEVDVDTETGTVQRVRWDERDDDSSGRGSDDDREDRDERDEDDWDDDRDARDDDDRENDDWDD